MSVSDARHGPREALGQLLAGGEWPVHDLHANCYVVKPVGVKEFETIVQAIDSFWLTVVTLPKTR